jgi:hypothetical protein
MPSQREQGSLGVWRDDQWVVRVAMRTREVERRAAAVRIQSDIMDNGILLRFAYVVFVWDSDGYLTVQKVQGNNR